MKTKQNAKIVFEQISSDTYTAKLKTRWILWGLFGFVTLEYVRGRNFYVKQEIDFWKIKYNIIEEIKK